MTSYTQSTDPCTTPTSSNMANNTADKIEPVTEKPIVEATDIPVNSDLDALESNAVRPSRDFKNAIYAIVGGVALPCIPIIVVSAVLLYVIFKHQVIPREGWPELYVATAKSGASNVTDLIREVRKEGGRPAYYVEYNPSTITTIASWTGRVIPYLSSSIMALVAFFAARHIVIKSKHGDHTQLPTPEQLTLLISMLGGSGFGPLKDTALYRWGRKEKLVAPLPAAFTALGIITLLGLVIPIVDTWFGVATQPETITQLYNTSTKAYHSYGRNLDPGTTDQPVCPNGPLIQPETDGNVVIWSWPCNLFITTIHADNIFFEGSQATAEVQLAQSIVNMISNYTGPASSGSGENQTFFFYGDSRSNTALDFKAQTKGISTQCNIATTRCGYGQQTGNSSYAFTCSEGFSGDLTYPYPNPGNLSFNSDGGNTVGVGYGTDAQLSQAAPWVNLTDQYLLGFDQLPGLLQQNPTYFASWAIGYPSVDPKNPLFTSQDPQVYIDGASVATWILNCSSTVYDVTYTYVNGGLHTFNATPAGAAWGAFFSAPFAWSYLTGLMPAGLSLQNAAYFAGYTAKNSTDLANIWAREYSRTALELSVGVFLPQTNDIEQVRNSTVKVARIPLIPLYLLLGFKFLYVVVVILLAIGAYCFTHPAETEVVKAQLSIKGLAAAHFDQPDLVRKNVVQEVQARLDQVKNGGGSSLAGQAPKRAATEPTLRSDAAAAEGAGAGGDDAPKVGLMATHGGTWKFVLLANGAWQSVKPIVQTVVLPEAQNGKLGAIGDAYAAWK